MRPSVPLLALLTAGCWVGQRASTFRPAQAPAGATIELQLRSGAAVSGELLAVNDTGYLVLDTYPFPNSAQAVRHSALFAGEIVRITAPGFLAHPDRVTIVMKRSDTLWARSTDSELVIPVGAVTRVETYRTKEPGGYTEWLGGPRIVYVPSHEVKRATPDFGFELRSVSRYPQGVTTELLTALLEAYGQSAPERPVAAKSIAS